MIFTLKLTNGSIGLFEAKNQEKAMQQALHQEGTNNVQSVKPATEEDIAWVQAMGGYVPPCASKTPSQ